MRRRDFLRGAAAAAVSGASPVLAELAAVEQGGRSAAGMTVGIAGAGIIGCSIARYLASRGCRVKVFEKFRPAAQASGNSFAWLNASYVKLPRSYHLLSTYSLHEYRRLAQELPLPVRFGGCLEWVAGDEASAELRRGMRNMQRFGAPGRMVTVAEAEKLEPAVSFHTDGLVAWSPLDGALHPAQATASLLADARSRGAELVMPAEVTAITPGSRYVEVEAGGQRHRFDRLVIASGVDATPLAASLGVSLPQRSTPGFIVTTAAMPMTLSGVVVAPGAHIHQLADGRFLIGEQGGPPDTDEHRQLLAGRPNSYPANEIALRHAERLLAIARKFVPRLGDAVVERVGIGWRPLPEDGLPVIGGHESAPGVYFAVMHSGMTLAPIVGRFASVELVDGIDVEMLADFRPARFGGQAAP